MKDPILKDASVISLGSRNLEFEKAAQLRDKIATLKGEKVAAPQIKKKRFKKR